MRKFASCISLVASVAVFVCLSAKPSSADQFDIGNTANCPNSPTGCPYLYPPGSSPNEVIGIAADTLTMFNHGGDDISTDYSTFLLIIGVPNGNSSSLTTQIASVVPNGGSTTQNPANIQFTGPVFQGIMTAGQSACDILGFPSGTQGACSSENFTNWSAADAAVLGINATQYAIFAYQISGISIPAVNPDAYITVAFAGSGLAVGNFATAYGCATAPLPCKNSDSTPFTQTGLVVQTPEPADIALLAPSLLFLGGVRRKWLRKLLG